MFILWVLGFIVYPAFFEVSPATGIPPPAGRRDPGEIGMEVRGRDGWMDGSHDFTLGRTSAVVRIGAGEKGLDWEMSVYNTSSV